MPPSTTPRGASPAGRRAQQPASVAVLPRTLRHDPALPHHQDPVTHLEQLLRVGRHPQHRTAVAASSSATGGSPRGRPRPRRGSGRPAAAPRRAASQRATCTFCWLPPLTAPDRGRRSTGPDAQARHLSRPRARFCSTSRKPRRAARRGCQHDVVRDRVVPRPASPVGPGTSSRSRPATARTATESPSGTPADPHVPDDLPVHAPKMAVPPRRSRLPPARTDPRSPRLGPPGRRRPRAAGPVAPGPRTVSARPRAPRPRARASDARPTPASCPTISRTTPRGSCRRRGGRHATRPSRITMTRSAIANTSDSRCETKMMATPRRAAAAAGRTGGWPRPRSAPPSARRGSAPGRAWRAPAR